MTPPRAVSCVCFDVRSSSSFPFCVSVAQSLLHRHRPARDPPNEEGAKGREGYGPPAPPRFAFARATCSGGESRVRDGRQWRGGGARHPPLPGVVGSIFSWAGARARARAVRFDRGGGLGLATTLTCRTRWHSSARIARLLLTVVVKRRDLLTTRWHSRASILRDTLECHRVVRRSSLNNYE